MDNETNKQIARDFMDAMSSGETERLLAMYTDDIMVWTAGSLSISGLHDVAEVIALSDGLP